MKEWDTPCLFGLETEYGVAVFERGTDSVPAPCMTREVFAAMLEAARSAPALPGYGVAGFFLANGARFYAENGLHLEYATPECPDPFTLATHVAAGDRLLRTWANSAGDGLKVDARILCHNVDGIGPEVSWGCHESYLVRDCLDNATLIKHLASHLATRIIYTGAGGTSGDGDFVLSPRATVIRTTDSHSTMHSRGLLDLYRQRPWAPDCLRRLHFCCGDTNRLQTPNILKVGTTALILILLQNGITPHPGLRLETPIEALWDLNCDPRLVAPVATATGFCNGIDLQRGLLEHCERHLGEPFMPPWSARLCSLWRSALDRLAIGAAEGLLEWPTKLALLKRHGLETPSSQRSHTTCRKLALNVRLSMLGGILDHLDAASGIERAVSDGEVKTATHRPPPGRASVRGKAIARCAPHGLANWTQVIDLAAGRIATLNDPFAKRARWAAFDSACAKDRYEGNATAIARLDYGRGNLRAVALQFNGSLDGMSEEILEMLFRASCEAGDFPRARDILHYLDSQGRANTRSQAFALALHCHAGLVPDAEAVTIYEALSARGPFDSGEIDAEIRYLGGRVLLALGQPRRAMQLLTDLRLGKTDEACDFGLSIRATAHLGDAFRRIGDTNGALKCLLQAEAAAKGCENGLHLADHVLPNLAKVSAAEPATAASHLGRAADIQHQLDHPFGLARTLLLKARICGNTLALAERDVLARQLRSLQTRVPALASCPRFNLILNLWHLWCEGRPHADFDDPFWNL